MPAPLMDEETFVRRIQEVGATRLAEELNSDVRSVLGRRQRIEQLRGTTIVLPDNTFRNSRLRRPDQRAYVDIRDGVVMVGSDHHRWPDEVSTAELGFLYLARELKPVVVIDNGDVFDGARISRHAQIGWNKSPTVKQELDAVRWWTEEVVKAAPHAEYYRNWGNHDARLDTYLSANAPELEGVEGASLKDRFPECKWQMSVWINKSVVVKHRMRGGVHATWNNVLHSGMTIVTGHLHNPNIRPFTDFRETRWGVDTGMMADPWGPQFDYMEDGVRNWRSSFGVLTFEDGVLKTPELVTVVDDGVIEFRGERIRV